MNPPLISIAAFNFSLCKQFMLTTKTMENDTKSRKKYKTIMFSLILHYSKFSIMEYISLVFFLLKCMF